MPVGRYQPCAFQYGVQAQGMKAVIKMAGIFIIGKEILSFVKISYRL